MSFSNICNRNVAIALNLGLALALTGIAVPTETLAQIIEPTPEGMALVPGGPFLMGNNNDFYDNDFDEKPRHVVNLPPFYMDIYPVTNQDYKVFVEATGHRFPQYWSDAGEIPAGKAQHPVIGVSYGDVMAYADWKGRRLPTEQEWEKAARGTEGFRWPWGNHFDESKANVGNSTTSPVGAYPDGCNGYGLCDMAGNVWEWTTTWYASYPDAPPNRVNLRFLNDTYLSVRGGSYGSDIGSARGADRGIKKPREFGPSLGFRTVLDPPGYEGYREALETIELARVIRQRAAQDISEYEEHADSRALMAESVTDLSKAEAAFESAQFMESGMLAQNAMSKATKAQQMALEIRRAYQLKKEAGTAEILGRLEMAIKNQAKAQNPGQKALIGQAENHLQLGRQLEAEGGWGYAQMHGYIGMSMLQRIKR